MQGCWLSLLALLLGAAGSVQAAVNVTLEVSDANPILGTVTRRFLLANVPTSSSGRGAPLSSSTPCTSVAPLMIGFHGQGGTPEDWKATSALTDLAAKRSFMLALPAGLREDVVGGTSGHSSDTTWNVGSADDDSTCLPHTNNTQCLSSCSKAGLCSGRW